MEGWGGGGVEGWRGGGGLGRELILCAKDACIHTHGHHVTLRNVLTSIARCRKDCSQHRPRHRLLPELVCIHTHTHTHIHVSAYCLRNYHTPV